MIKEKKESQPGISWQKMHHHEYDIKLPFPQVENGLSLVLAPSSSLLDAKKSIEIQ